MKLFHLSSLALAAALPFALVLSPLPASADALSSLKAFTLADVQTAEAIYAANPDVPTKGAADQCLTFLDDALSQPGAPLTVGNYTAPDGIVSAVADLDVAVNEATGGLPKPVLAFNQSCGGYVEDLKAEAAAHAFGLTLFGVTLF